MRVFVCKSYDIFIKAELKLLFNIGMQFWFLYSLYFHLIIKLIFDGKSL